MPSGCPFQRAKRTGEPPAGGRGSAPLEVYGCRNPATIHLQNPRGSAQKHFHTDAPTGRRCESAFMLLSHRESNKEVAMTGYVW